ncbi:MAG: 50S ribosomal protein L30 [Candidatus Methanoperedens sp.]|nr:50S ribosomal protein L30 [Candidatus Methanoperedens sp.]MCE8424729.1 50S ribosomal protein L30 [Candidatus Methanoperedens sp.]MCE8427167.1 50S ribosomal protein L30 [Candidatus Methanoperedens sp.]
MYAAVRLRGGVKTRQDIKDTLAMMRLDRINHCVIIPETSNYQGMIRKAKDYIAWGPIDAETLAQMLENRGKLEGGKDLTEEYLSKNTNFKSFLDLANAICEGKAQISDVPKMKPVFRMHPARKGLKGTKRNTLEGGDLGFHGIEMKTLLNKMR